MSSRICTRCAWRAWWIRRIALSSRFCTRCVWRTWWTWFINVLVSASFIIGFSRLIGGIGSGFIIIFSFINESLNPGDYNFVRQWFTFIFIYNSVFNFYAIVSLSNWLKFKIYVFRFRNFSVFFYIVYCNITW